MKNMRWTQEEINILKENYKFGNIYNIEKMLPNRTYGAITTKAEKLGLKTREYWSNKEIEILINNYEKCPIDEIILLLPNRNRHGIIAKAISLNLTNKTILDTRFNEKEKEFVSINYNHMTDKEIGKKLGRSSSAVNNYRFRNGLIKIYEKSSYNDLSDYIRRNNMEWKTQSIMNCNYQCILTKDRFDDIHHIYGFNLILNETIETLGISIKEYIDDYTDVELRNFLDTFRLIQSKYPLGVCLRKDIHMLFHNIYGYGDNTQKQWNEFLNNYNNGEYNYILHVA